MTEPSKSSNWKRRSLTWGKRIIITLLVITCMCYGVLLLAQRSKEPIRLGLEDYLEQSTGQSAEITDLSVVKFVPNVIFDMKDVIIRDRTDPKKTLVRAERFYVSMPFWHMLFGINDYEAFEIKNLDIASGYVLPKKLHIGTVGITGATSSDLPSYFTIDGMYNNQPLLITAQMIRNIRKDKPILYFFPRTFPMTYKLGPLEGGGTYVRNMTDVQIQNGTLIRDVNKIEFTLGDMQTKPLKAYAMGKINEVPFNAELTKSGDTTLLTIIPAERDPGSLLKMNTFISDLQKDLGLDGKTQSFKIELKGVPKK